jgi:UDP-N-acetylglucosamine 2-epimerase (non-hydrolysing)
MGPVYAALRQRREHFEVRVCLSGQHRELAAPFVAVFRMPADYQLDVMAENQSLDRLAARIIEGLGSLVDRWAPDWVLGQGDTTTALCAALVSFYRGIPFGHVEAGLRTYDPEAPYPEESNRRMIAPLASLHFAPTRRACENLRHERIARERIVLTGNTVVDALHMLLPTLQAAGAEMARWAQAALGDRRMVLVTAHRRESFGDGLVEICRAVRALAAQFPSVEWVYPVHLNPNVRVPVRHHLEGLPNVHLLDALGYARFLWLLKRSHLVLTDSGGVQEEAPSFGKPVLVLRERTERPEGVDAGIAKLVGLNRDTIVAETRMLLTNAAEYDRMVPRANPYGNGRAALLIADALARSSGARLDESRRCSPVYPQRATMGWSAR